MAFMATIRGLGLSFHILLGFRAQAMDVQGDVGIPRICEGQGSRSKSAAARFKDLGDVGNS